MSERIPARIVDEELELSVGHRVLGQLEGLDMDRIALRSLAIFADVQDARRNLTPFEERYTPFSDPRWSARLGGA